VPGDQLSFPVPPGPAQRLPLRLTPMQPTPIEAPFDDPAYLFEPWWPGARALIFSEAGHLRLQVEQLSDPLLAFPELTDLTSRLRVDGVVVDGTLLVLDAHGRPDAELLRRRLERGGRVGEPAYVATDLLWAEGKSIMRRAYRSRREQLGLLLAEGPRLVVGRGYEGEGTLVAEALAGLGIGSLSARRFDARYRSGPAGDAWLRAPLIAAVPERLPPLALIQRLPL
jgi:bifunctional non-homologous end joining protein LigD